jgi:hypothetical protein
VSRAARTLALGVCLAFSLTLRLHADDLSALLDKVAGRVADFYAGTQSLVVQETVRIQHENGSMGRIGHASVLVYDDHVEWTPASDAHPAEASVVRQLLKIDGRSPRPARDDDDWRCFQNATTSAEPLGILLPGRRDAYIFTSAGTGKTDGRNTIMIDYRERVVGNPKATWDDRCLTLDLPGRERGRIWIDAQTFDVLRVDEQITGNFPVDYPKFKDGNQPRDQYMTLLRANTTTRYQLMTFEKPDEQLLVPKSIESFDQWSGSDNNIRITQTFSRYRRFVGESHIVPSPGE